MISKIAVLGVSGLKNIVLKVFNKVVRLDYPGVSFNTEEEALEYLVS